MRKINFTIILALVVSMFIGAVSYASDDLYRERIPRVIFEQPESIPEARAGETFNLTIKYVNDSEHSAYDMRFTPDFENVPLVYERPVVFEREKSLRARNSAEVSFSFKVKDDAKIGVYGLKFKLEYANLRNENYSREETIYFKVVEEKVKPIMLVNNISAGESVISADSNFQLSFDVANAGEITAENVELKLTGLTGDAFMVVNSNDYRYLGNMESGVTKHVAFDMYASENIKKGLNTLTAEIKYNDTTGNEYTVEKTIYILDVKSDNESSEDDGGAKPKIIISSYSTSPSSIVAGKPFDFTFTFKNTSTDKKLRNMKITLSAADGAFIITKGSNTFYIEELGVEEEMVKSIELKSKQDLTSNSYPITLDFDYEDFTGKEYTASETINIPVTEYSKLVINSVYAGEAYLGSNTSLSFDYINMGKATISNLTASVEGDYTSVQSINYIGNLTAGSSDYYDIEVTPTKSGANYGTLVLAFEDSSGQIIEERKEFEGFAMEMTIPDDPGIVEPGLEPVTPVVETEEPIETWIIVVSGIGAFLVTFFLTKVITTKIVRKRLEDEI